MRSQLIIEKRKCADNYAIKHKAFGHKWVISQNQASEIMVNE